MLKRTIAFLLLIFCAAVVNSETKQQLRPVKSSILFQGRLFSILSYEYDKKGNLVKISEENKMEESTASAEYKYTADNRCTEIREYSNDKLTSIISLKYDEKGQHVMDTYMSADRKVLRVKKYEYTDGKLYRKNEFESGDNLTHYIELKYENNRLSAIVMCAVGEYTMDVIMVYDDAGYIIEEKIKHSTNPDADLKRAFTYEKGYASDFAFYEIFTN